MTYALAWLLYVVAAVALVSIYWRYLEGFLPQVWGLILRVFLITVLFTPWVVQGANGNLPAPACIAVLFSLLAHAREDALRALAAIVGASLLVITVLLIRVRPDASPADPVLTDAHRGSRH